MRGGTIHAKQITRRFWHMEQITRRSMKTLDAKDDKNGGSAPPTAGHGIYPPPAQASVSRMTYPEIKTNKQAHEIDLLGWENHLSSPALNLACYCDSEDFDKERRDGRQTEAKEFRSEYTYGSVKEGCNNSMEQRTCIWPRGTLSWQDKSSGIMWVGVHGMDSICVVTRSEDLDTTRLRGSLMHFWPIHEILFQFRKSVIVEIEDLADPSSEIRERFHKRIKKPFGVVSVIPGAYKSRKRCHEASSVEYGETKAKEFLHEKVKSDTVFTVKETIQTAIAAFGHLIQKKLKADEIQVSVMDPNYMVYTFEDKDPTVENLKIRQINEHLAVINKRGPLSKRKMEPCPKESSSGSRRLRERKC